MLLLAAKSAGDISRAANHGKRHGVNGVFHTAVRSTLGLHAFDACGRSLPSRKSVNLVIHYDISQVYVAAHRVQEMIAADAVTVAIAADANDLEIVVAKLHTRTDRQ